MDKNAPKLAYTVTEALRAVGIGRTTLYAEIAAGHLKVIRIGRRTLIPADNLKSWLDSKVAA